MTANIYFSMCVLLCVCLYGVEADFQCVCNYNVEVAVMPKQSEGGAPLGSMYEFDCKQNIVSMNTDQWFAVAFMHTIGYVQVSSKAQQQVCTGEPAPEDKVTTKAPSKTSPTTVSTRSPSITPAIVTLPTTLSTLMRSTTSRSTMPSTSTTAYTSLTSTISYSTKPSTRMPSSMVSTMKLSTSPTSQQPTSSTMMSTTSTMGSSTPMVSATKSTTQLPTTHLVISSVIPPSGATPDVPGAISRCPSNIRSQSKLDGGALGYFQNSCYELIPGKVNHEHAYQLCKSRGGNMVDILSSQEQDYLYAFLKQYSPRNVVWIGLYDRRTEGTFEWTSGAAVSYTNWIPSHTDNFVSHNDEDCVLMIPYKNGQWDDTPCGFSGIFGDIGESHPSLCEYNFVVVIPDKNGQWDDTPCGFSGIFGDIGESHPSLCEYKLSSGNAVIG